MLICFADQHHDHFCKNIQRSKFSNLLLSHFNLYHIDHSALHHLCAPLSLSRRGAQSSFDRRCCPLRNRRLLFAYLRAHEKLLQLNFAHFAHDVDNCTVIFAYTDTHLPHGHWSSKHSLTLSCISNV